MGDFATKVSGTRDLVAASGATAIVLADSADGVRWEGDAGVSMVGRLARIAPAAIVICAGAWHRELVEQAAAAGIYPRARILGTAPEALASAVRTLVALEAGGSPREVSLTVLGVPPLQAIVPWEEATISGLPLDSVLDGPARRRLAARVPALWPPGPQTLAVAAIKALTAIDGATRARLSCFVAQDTGAGTRFRTVAVPVRLDGAGVASVEIPTLSGQDRTLLDNAMVL
jgi:malate/lactate dehydrogenase